LRINFFGGPGAGKSTSAARVFAQLKERQVSVEHVGEYVKAWAYQQRNVTPFDQVYIFGKQHQYEYRYLSRGVQNIVTDSPCFLSAYYARLTKPELAGPILELVDLYDDDHPCHNIFLHRRDKPYVQEGRWQDEAGARRVDAELLLMLRGHYPDLTELDYSDQDGILHAVLAVVD